MVAVYVDYLDWESHPCPPLPHPNLNGKEGVNGSSPLEGFAGKGLVERNWRSLSPSSGRLVSRF
jgi:hypothetical protein